jgi:hypothetical protein
MSGSLAIPASAIVSVVPSVISAGGNALDLNGLMLTNSTRAPLGVVLSFSSQADVAAYFGGTSLEAALATVYFLGFDNSNQKPGAMLFTQYNTASVGAWLRGASLAGMTLAQLQALSGTVSATIDGTLRTSSPVNLSAATSFSNAAELISIALGLTGPAGASFTGSISGTTLTVSALTLGTLVPGQEVRGAGTAAGTVITGFLTGTGGTGTYQVSTSQTVASGSMTSNTPTVTYDPVSSSFVIVSATTGATSSMSYGGGTLAPSLKLRQADGAVTSQGAVAAAPATFMQNVLNQSQNWATFSHCFDPDAGSGSTLKQAFATWVNGTIDRFLYFPWDTDVAPTISNAATSSLGWVIQNAAYDGIAPIWDINTTEAMTKAAMGMGYVASIDFSQTNGRATMAFKSQSGLTANIVNRTIADNLIANGYNYYGSYATANDMFRWMYPGQLSGKFEWVDSYINQIWLNNQFQLALMVLLQQAKSIPYNDAGYGLIRAALLDPINQGLNFGAFRAGVTLSEAQKAEVNNAAGKKIDDTLRTQGWYLQVKDASPQVRAARGSPPCTFWYMDGQSVQRLNLASVLVQ